MSSSRARYVLAASGRLSQGLLKAFGSLQNSYKFNGGSELNEDFGLQWYETGARLYDPQLGRFLQIDGLADIYSDWSPYVFALNNPTRYIDPTGLEPEDPAEETKKIQGCEDGGCLWNVIVRPGQAVEYYWGESNFGAHIQQYRGGNHTGPMTGGGHGKVYKAAETVLEIGEYIPGVGGKVATGVKVVFYYFNGEKEQAREALWDLLPFRKLLKKLSLANKALGVVQDAGKAAQRAAAKVAASAAKTVGKGTQVNSKTLWKGKGKERIDVENPNPSQRPGQVHYQDNKGGKYIYDPSTGQFKNAPNHVNDLLKNSEFKRGIEKGLKYLGF